MIKNCVLFLLFAFGFVLLRPAAWAEDQCTDLLIHFVEPSAKSAQQGTEEPRRITAVIPCERHLDPSSVGAPTTIHILERNGNQFCMAQRTCGNLWGWQGAFAVTVGWSDLTLLGDFYLLRDSLRFHKDWNGNRLVATFALRGGQIERDCSPLTPPACVSVWK